jgi:hypothetical protein
VDEAVDERNELFAGAGKNEGAAVAFQSSLKLVESAEIQIWRTGVLGVITNSTAGSSKTTLRTPNVCKDQRLSLRLVVK